MRKRWIALLVIVSAVSLSGCFIDYTGDPTVQFDGNISTTDSGLSMDGALSLGGSTGDTTIHNISLIAYSESGEMLYRQQVGSFQNGTTRLPLSFSMNQTPEYIVFRGEGLYEKAGEVEYYYRSGVARGGYGEEDATAECELPVTPDCN